MEVTAAERTTIYTNISPLAQRVNNYIQTQHSSIAAVAKDIGYSRTTVSRYLTGKYDSTPAFGRIVSGTSKCPGAPSGRDTWSSSRNGMHLAFSYLRPPCSENFEMDKISETVDLGSGSQNVIAVG